MHRSCHWYGGPCFQTWKFKRRHSNPEVGCPFLKYKPVQYIFDVNNLAGWFFKKIGILVSDKYMDNQLLVEESDNPTYLFSEEMFLVQKGKKCWFLISLFAQAAMLWAWRQSVQLSSILILKHMVRALHKVHVRKKCHCYSAPRVRSVIR